ncbi:MAG: hypothetical protein ACTSR3_01370 [Candidatus Helarchaeota archaeon]
MKCPNCKNTMHLITVGQEMANSFGINIRTDEEFYCENCKTTIKTGKKIVFEVKR